MESAIDETNRRRAKQVAYNKERGVDPQPLRKKIADITEMLAREDEDTQALLATWAGTEAKGRAGGVKAPASRCPALGQLNAGQHAEDLAGLPSSELAALIQELTDQMKARRRRAAVRAGRPAARRDQRPQEGAPPDDGSDEVRRQRRARNELERLARAGDQVTVPSRSLP